MMSLHRTIDRGYDLLPSIKKLPSFERQHPNAQKQRDFTLFATVTRLSYFEDNHAVFLDAPDAE